jgi:hypothetical protein
LNTPKFSANPSIQLQERNRENLIKVGIELLVSGRNTSWGKFPLTFFFPKKNPLQISDLQGIYLFSLISLGFEPSTFPTLVGMLYPAL